MTILDHDTEIIPAHLHRLAHTVQVAAFGPDGVFDPSWLDETGTALIFAAHEVFAMAARARIAAGPDSTERV